LAIAAVVVAVWAILVWFQPPTVLMVIVLILGAIAVAVWPVAMSATGTLARLQFEVPKLSDVDATQLASLQQELEALDDKRPVHQLGAMRDKRNNLVDVLNRRLDAGELTYARYLSTAQRVYLSALDNLHEAAISLRSISTIDREYIETRLDELKSLTSDNAQSERASLEGRLALLTSQEDKLARLLAQNESGMTAMDRTATALADAPIGRAPADAEAAMEALEELAQRAMKYATG
jgi:DNA-binding transcriptional MerR regulator